MSLCPLIFQLEIRKLLDSKSNLISSRNETISLDSFITREGRRRAVIAQSVVRPIGYRARTSRHGERRSTIVRASSRLHGN